MKRSLLLFVLSTSLPFAALAQSPPPGPGASPSGAHQSVLTAEERQEVHKAHEAALAGDPSLAAEDKDLKAQVQAARAAGSQPGPELMSKLQEHHQKLRAAMIKADPNVAPLLDKLDQAHHQGSISMPPTPPPGA